MKRWIVASLALVAAALDAPSAVTAQSHYTHAVIADLGTAVGSAPHAPSIDDFGQVAFAYQGDVFRSDGGPLTAIYVFNRLDPSAGAGVAGGPVSVSNSGKVAFVGNSFVGGGKIAVSDGVTLRIVAELPTWNVVGNLSINNQDVVAFDNHVGSTGGLTGNIEVIVESASGFNRVAQPGDLVPGGTITSAHNPRINDSGQVVFVGLLSDGTANIYRADGAIPTLIGGGSLGSLNAGGDVAYWSGAIQGILVGSGGPTSSIVTPTPLRQDPHIAAINDVGDVAFQASETSGNIVGVFVGNATESWPVLQAGDTIPGVGTVLHAYSGNEALNNRGQVAILVEYADASGAGGKFAVVRADPLDQDADDDGVPDDEDAFPNDPAESRDLDGDGVGDNVDPDDDGDGQSDADESACGSNPQDAGSQSPDVDSDGRPDCVDINPPPVTIVLEAQVYEIVDTLGLVTGVVHPGDLIAGNYTYDTTRPDENPDPSIGRYSHTSLPFGIALNAGGLQFRSNPEGMNFYQAFLNLASGDFFLLQSIGGNLFDVAVCPTATNVISWQLDDPSGTALSGTELPTEPLDLGDWQSNIGLKIESYGCGHTLSIRTHVTAVSLQSTYPPNVAATPTGTNIVLQPTATLPDGSTATVSLEFDSVVSGGTTTVNTSTSGPPPPAGFKLGHPPIYYDVSTTATFEGSVALCFTWVEGRLNNENNARLFHFENNAWVDVTVSLDTETNTICGSVTSLSPFTFGEKAYTFGGFDSPLLPDGSATIQQSNGGRTIPVKFRMSWNGAIDPDASATLAVFKILNVASGTTDMTDLTADAGASNDSGNVFRFDAVDQRYVFNLSTKGWSAPATYRIVVTLSDGSVYTVDFSLR